MQVRDSVLPAIRVVPPFHALHHSVHAAVLNDLMLWETSQSEFFFEETSVAGNFYEFFLRNAVYRIH